MQLRCRRLPHAQNCTPAILAPTERPAALAEKLTAAGRSCHGIRYRIRPARRPRRPPRWPVLSFFLPFLARVQQRHCPQKRPCLWEAELHWRGRRAAGPPVLGVQLSARRDHKVARCALRELQRKHNFATENRAHGSLTQHPAQVRPRCALDRLYCLAPPSWLQLTARRHLHTTLPGDDTTGCD